VREEGRELGWRELTVEREEEQEEEGRMVWMERRKILLDWISVREQE